MKTGLVRYIDDLGRIVLPKELRKTADIIDGDPLEIWVDDDGTIRLQKYIPKYPDLIQEVTRLQRHIDESENNSDDKYRWIRTLEKVRKEMQFAERKRHESVGQ